MEVSYANAESCLLGLSISMERPIDIVLFIIIIFFPPKNRIYAVIRIERLCGPFYSTSQKMFLIDPAYLTFDLLRSYSTYCEKPLLADLLQNRLYYMHEN